jgi:hypothetical protein
MKTFKTFAIIYNSTLALIAIFNIYNGLFVGRNLIGLVFVALGFHFVIKLKP